MNKTPLISIITVVYNGEKYLEQTIESVLNQTYNNIEYIIIDGKSIDGTLDIIKSYEKYISYWISESDKGLYDAMNKGIAISKGELIGIINSDDWYELDAVELMVNAYLEHPDKNIFHADLFNVDEKNNRKIKRWNNSGFRFKYYAMTYNHPSMFITNKEYAMHKYNMKMRALADYQFILESYLKDENSLYYIDKPIVNYRLDGISANRTLWQGLKEGYEARKLAEMSCIERVFAFLLGMSVSLFYSRYRILRMYVSNKRSIK